MGLRGLGGGGGTCLWLWGGVGVRVGRQAGRSMNSVLGKGETPAPASSNTRLGTGGLPWGVPWGTGRPDSTAQTAPRRGTGPISADGTHWRTHGFDCKVRPVGRHRIAFGCRRAVGDDRCGRFRRRLTMASVVPAGPLCAAMRTFVTCRALCCSAGLPCPHRTSPLNGSKSPRRLGCKAGASERD